jgi:uncharacterized protein (DUF1697 family)
MKTHIILLRGVMPIGKNKVPMATLREVLGKAKFKEVRTYIQSGNVILKSDLSPKELEKKIHEIIKTKMGPELAVVVRSRSQLAAILEANPLSHRDPSRVFYTLFATKPAKEKCQELMKQKFLPEEIIIADTVAYVFIPGSAARAQLTNNTIEKKLGISTTTRNLNTLTKLIELSR